MRFEISPAPATAPRRAGDLSKRPVLWRPGAVWVEDQDGHAVYEAPDAEEIEPLMAKLVDQLDTTMGSPMIRAAMAQLNLTMIHPFSDGNGRMGRCLQSRVLAADGIIFPELPLSTKTFAEPPLPSRPFSPRWDRVTGSPSAAPARGSSTAPPLTTTRH
jgi:hypothetical protein